MSTLKAEADEERASYMQQVSRVKSDTLTLVQQENDKEREKAVNAAASQRDDYWQQKVGDMEDEQAKKLASKVKGELRWRGSGKVKGRPGWGGSGKR